LDGKTPDELTPIPVIPITTDSLADAISWEVDDNAVDFIDGLE